MRNNQPITRTEQQVKDGAFLVSQTDCNGIIVFANDEFVRLSGYSHGELIGQQHNIVRHPEMPSVVFAELWTTIKAGKPWHGVVKNRCKNGDFYWVDANITPLIENGQLKGYVSIRSKPSRAQIGEAELLYKFIQAGGKAEDLFKTPFVPLASKSFRFQLNAWLGLLLGLVALMVFVHMKILPSHQWLMGGTLFVIAVGMLASYFLSKGLRVQIGGDAKEALALVYALSAGDMRAEIQTRSGDRHSLLANLRLMQSQLKGMINRIRFDATRVQEGAAATASSNNEISSTAQELARVAEEQRASVERMATAINELSVSIQEVFNNVKRSQGQATEALQVTEKGDRSGIAAMEAMTRVEEATAKVVVAVRVIQDIARQTNLLSLNAAIEAAKAGAMGKGFAVVAEEVRKLAERSAQAAKEIANLIEGSNMAVEQGKSTVQETVLALAAIREHIGQVDEMSTEIAVASEEQAKASAEVAEQVELGARKAAENASASIELSATVESTARTTDQLAHTALGLTDLMKQFRA